MGARGIGHIAYLTRIAPPRIGVVLNVGTAHIGEFGGREQIAQAKGELVEALPADGRRRSSTPTTRSSRHGRPDAGTGRPVRRGPTPTYGRRGVGSTSEGTARLHAGHTRRVPLPVTLAAVRCAPRVNALAAAAVAHELGMPLREIAAALSEADPRQPLADGGHRAARRRDGRQRRLQREPRVHAGRAARAGGAWREGAPDAGRCSARWPSSAPRPSPSTTRSDSWPSGSTSPGSSSVGAGRGVLTARAPSTRVHGLRSRCTCPTSARR